MLNIIHTASKTVPVPEMSDLLEALGFLVWVDPDKRDFSLTYGKSQHGTWARYMKHYRDGEEPCAACRRTATEHRKKYDKPKPKRRLKPCGTWAAYTRHIANGEVPCEPCVKAARDRSRLRRKKNGFERATV